MRYIRNLLLIFVVIIILWIDLPTTIKLVNPLNKKQKVEISSLSIHLNKWGIVFDKEFKTHYGLDLNGGLHLAYQADMSKTKKEDKEDAIRSARDIIERRVNFFGVSEPSIQTVRSGSDYRITVDLPGTNKSDEAIKLIGTTAQLSFREELPPSKDPKIASLTAGRILFNQNAKLKGNHIKKATVVFDPNTGKPQVSLSFSSEGAKIFADLTRANVGKRIGIFIDQDVLSAPVVQQAIVDGNAVITGTYSLDEAKKLAVSINSGALPVPIKLVEQRTIAATLGASEIQKSIYAGIIGLLAVMLFMVVYYGNLGWIACMCLIIYGLLSLALFRGIPVTLTLSGVAGFILSIGMAVDSNILIFERIKEEQRKGKDMDTAIRLGFGRAIDAIKDANVTTLLVSFILFNPLNWEFLPQFGLVRGFALTLAIGVAMSLFTGVFITRRLIYMFYRQS